MSTGARIVLILFIASLIAGAVSGTQFYFRIAYVWGLLLLISWLWSWHILKGVTLTRQARATRAQVGQILEEKIEVDNAGRLPRLWIAVRDASPLPGAQGSRLFPVIEGRRGRTYLARNRLLHRGVFSLGPTVLESGDPFGLFPVSRLFPADESLIVYPLLVDIQSFPSPTGILPGGEALRRRTPQVTPNASGVREYAPGDPLNRIHWVSTARRDRLISKEFELDPQAEVWIILDAAKTEQSSIPYTPPKQSAEDLWKRKYDFTLPPTTEEYGVSIAASVARYFLRIGRAVGFVSSGQSSTAIPPDRGGRQLGKILESLALLRAVGKLPLSALIELQAQHMPRGSTVVIITPSVKKEIPLVADYLERRGLRPVVILLDARSFDGISGSDKLVAMLDFLRVPVRVIRNGDNIGVALSIKNG
jgi:uncharacterized protein (DUF58 family)